ncbi:branched-chain amino acid aminotransferase [Aureimonas ureilytica]|uniref:Branched-chain-amino-acid aminotransferase n=1 Tax=Aureimonas ureilytica TaxID=401562 RepID=A0A175R568_9HYPH|nr:branched-chain amino acid aminotransferase [Aureimonas ureilytica]KTQ85303.1 branched-chain amino acid aminotransferase [Aureimonas ureilytica]
MTVDAPGIRFELKRSSNPVPAAERAEALSHLTFGTLFSDHMAVARWSQDRGWHSAEITARAPFPIDPASSVLHYAQEIFEGMKAYRTADGRALLFRPEENARRFNQSARRMAMPELPEADFVAAVEGLVAVDQDWLPEGEASLYLRPFMFASESFLGVRPSREYIFCVIASPVGPYFKGGSKPLTLWVSQNYSRAARGGTGEAKCGGNYAGSLAAQAEASTKGCDQVVFLDSAENRWVEELGGMNLFFVMADGRLVTPSLGTILPGITRKSIIEMASAEGHIVEERPYSFDEWQADAASGRMKEAFACGTAAVVAGIGTLRHAGGEFTIGDGQVGPTTEAFRHKLVGIQRGAAPDSFGWTREVARAG